MDEIALNLRNVDYGVVQIIAVNTVAVANGYSGHFQT